MLTLTLGSQKQKPHKFVRGWQRYLYIVFSYEKASKQAISMGIAPPAPPIRDLAKWESWVTFAKDAREKLSAFYEDVKADYDKGLPYEECMAFHRWGYSNNKLYKFDNTKERKRLLDKNLEEPQKKKFKPLEAEKEELEQRWPDWKEILHLCFQYDVNPRSPEPGKLEMEIRKTILVQHPIIYQQAREEFEHSRESRRKVSYRREP
jgi:hypothetical protein